MTTKKVKIKLLEDFAGSKKGEELLATPEDAEKTIAEGLAEYVEPEKVNLGKTISDEVTIENKSIQKSINKDKKGLYPKTLAKQDYLMLGIKEENYERWAERQNNKILDNEKIESLKFEVIQNIALKRRDEATELIVRFIKKNRHIYTTKDDLKSEMWIYENGVYVPQGRTEIKMIVRKVLEEAFTTHFCNEVISKIEADTSIDQDLFFKTNYVNEVPVENGILNVITREVKPFDPKKIFFNKLPIIYNPKEKCPNILNHFKTVLKSEEDVPVMLELFGYLLYKEYKIEQAFMFLGKGRNGKSKTLELMKRFVGAENCSSIPLKAMNEESFDIWELFGKMVNLAGDLSKTDLKETGVFKNLVGRDTISARRKFLNVIKFVNYAKMVFACNELPRIYDTTDGFWTKWILLEFPYQFISEAEYSCLSEEEKKTKRIINPDIMETLGTKEELSGLLNLALDGLDRLLKNKGFSYSKGTEEVRQLWIRKSDSFMAFSMDCLEEDYNHFVPKSFLRKVFSYYCKTYKIAGVSDKSIKATLEEMHGASEGRKTFNGDFLPCWEGIKFNIKGIKGIMGFSTLYKILNLAIGSNMVDTLDRVDSYDINQMLRIDKTQ